MHPRYTLRRLLAPALVALSIVVSSAPAFAIVPTSGPAPEAQVQPASVPSRVGSRDIRGAAVAVAASPSLRAVSTAAVAEWSASTAAREAAIRAKPTKTATPKTSSTHATHATHATSYRGRNHVWIPSLGVSRSVSFFSCSSSAAVLNYVYRWGCAGSNNVYLFGHAGSVFRPLHDAYVQHRLSVGMRVVYADGAGRVRTYRVSFWKVVTPTNGAWAYAAQSRPSMTLQTCLGANSQYRLIVRLTRV